MIKPFAITYFFRIEWQKKIRKTIVFELKKLKQEFWGDSPDND